jgi:type I pantothenate kinase
LTLEGFLPPPNFALVDRATWATGAQGRPRPDDSPVDQIEWREIYIPLSTRIEKMISGVPLLVGVAGSVAAGKSTFAGALAALLDDAVVISTDSFLLPTAALGRRAGFKGFPDTYDRALFDDTLRRLAAGESVMVPRYSHEIYDIAGQQRVPAASVVIVEGINALAPDISFGIYLDASEPDLRAWYVARFLAHIDEARRDPSSFFAQWVGLPETDARQLANMVWETVNLVNLVENILPTRWNADLVMRKARSHNVEAIALRAG